MGQLAKNSVIVTVFNVLGTSLVLISNIIIAYKFGAGRDMDIYFAATTIPFFAMTIVSVSLSFTFIPVFTVYEKRKDRDTWEVVSSFINIIILAVSIFCLAGIIWSKTITKIITPGFDALKVKEAAMLMSILLPTVIFTAINELLASIYYAHNRFITPSLNKVLNPLMTITLVVLLGSSLGTKTLALAILLAYFSQSIFLVFGFLRHRDFQYTPVINRKHPEVKKIFTLMAPLIFAMLITKAMPITDRFFLSQLSVGSISHVSYALKMTLRLSEIAASGVVIALFPEMAKYAAALDYNRLYDNMVKAIKVLFFIIIPFVVLLAFYGKPIIGLIFERGAFTAYDTEAVFRAFVLYLIIVPLDMALGIICKGFYAIQNTKTVAIVSTCIMVFYVMLCYSLLGKFDYLAIPVSYLISFIFAIVISWVLVRRALHIKGSYGVASEAAKSAISALMAATFIIPGIRLFKDNPFAYIGLYLAAFVLYFIVSNYIFRIEASRLLCEHSLNFMRTLLEKYRKNR